jgi:hypothetical protein
MRWAMLAAHILKMRFLDNFGWKPKIILNNIKIDLEENRVRGCGLDSSGSG